MITAKYDKKYSNIRPDRARRAGPAFRALGLTALGITIVICQAANAQLGGLGVGTGLGGSLGGVLSGGGLSGGLSLPGGIVIGGMGIGAPAVMISPGSAPVMLAGLGAGLGYELVISGPASATLEVQYANAVMLGGSYQWLALTNVVLDATGQAIIAVSIPLGQT